MKSCDVLIKYCKILFYTGSSNFWHDKKAIGDDSSIFYKLYTFIVFILIMALIILEFMVSFVDDFPDEVQRDALALSFSRLVVVMKIYSVFAKKERVKALNRDLAYVCETYEQKISMDEQFQVIRNNTIMYFVIVYGAFLMYVLEGFNKFYHDSTFASFAIYLTPVDDFSIRVNLIRIAVHIVVAVYIFYMILTVDCFVMIHLVIFKYKFKTLGSHFQELKNITEETLRTETLDVASEKLRNGLIDGVKMHRELIRLYKEFEYCFGFIIALQLAETFCCAVLNLLQIALSENVPVLIILKAALFLATIFFMLGLFLCNAGMVTEESLSLSDAVAACGWELCLSNKPVLRDIRRLVELICAQSQRPLVIMGFNLFALNHATFVEVAKSSYSVFALFYAQKQ